MPNHGGKRPGAGRKPGSKNHRTLRDRDALWSYIEERSAAGYVANPFTFMIDTLADASIDTAQRLHAAVALADRLMPRLKATEHSGEITQHILTGDERRARIEALLAQRNGHAH